MHISGSCSAWFSSQGF